MILHHNDRRLQQKAPQRAVVIKLAIHQHARYPMHQPRDTKRNEKLNILGRKRTLAQTQHIPR